MLYEGTADTVTVLLVHPGGPLWAKRDTNAWSIPKGETEEGEDLLGAARREFAEELGRPLPNGTYLPLGNAKLTGGKVIYAWALQAEFDVLNIKSNSFTMEWPPKSGKQQQFPEIDRAGWFSLSDAYLKIHKSQVPLLAALAHMLQLAVPPAESNEPKQRSLL